MPNPAARGSVLAPAILLGGFVAGTLDLLSAFHTFGWEMPRTIASGILGVRAFPQAGGGRGAWLLGVALHYAIALGAAAIYCGSSRWLPFLRKHFLFGAIVCGMGVWAVMNTIVVPMSAVPMAPPRLSPRAIRIALSYQIVLIGLPMALSLWWFAHRSERIDHGIEPKA